MNTTDIEWVFVCQSGRLEPEACLLAASLRRFLGEDAKLIASIPTPESVMGVVSSPVLKFLSAMNVQCIATSNRLIEEKFQGDSLSLKMMNKVFALEVPRNGEISIFLDTDHLCLAPFASCFLTVPMVGRCVGYVGALASEAFWEKAYAICEVAIPQSRFVIQKDHTGFPYVITYPYFNSGFISIHNAWRDQLINHYIDCYQRIARENLLAPKRYFEEQMALSLAVLKCGVPYVVDHRRIDASFLHYNNVERLRCFPKAVKLVHEFVQASPDLGRILRNHADWNSLIEDSNA
jgi:hypothetical protein